MSNPLQIKTEEFWSPSIRISVRLQNEEAGHAFVYFLKNELHDQTFALLEDVFVQPWARNREVGEALVQTALLAARDAGAYKIIGTIKKTQRPGTERWYRRFGFFVSGTELRLDMRCER